MKLALFWLVCLSSSAFAFRQRSATKQKMNSIYHEPITKSHHAIVDHEDSNDDNDNDPRPKTHNFGLPRIPVDAPVGSHDFSSSNPKFHANREVLEFTQLSSGTDNPKAHNPNIDNPLASVQKMLEEGENMVENSLNDELGISVPTKVVEGHDEENGLELIKLATAMLKELIATPRHQSRLPLGIVSSALRSRGRHSATDNAGSSPDTGGKSPDLAQAQRSLLELLEQLAKLGLDESTLQDPAFEQLLERIKQAVSGFQSRPVLRT